MTDSYAPRRDHRFTFGPWTVGIPGRDPFGDTASAGRTPVEIVPLFADPSATGRDQLTVERLPGVRA